MGEPKDEIKDTGQDPGDGGDDGAQRRRNCAFLNGIGAAHLPVNPAQANRPRVRGLKREKAQKWEGGFDPTPSSPLPSSPPLFTASAPDTSAAAAAATSSSPSIAPSISSSAAAPFSPSPTLSSGDGGGDAADDRPKLMKRSARPNLQRDAAAVSLQGVDPANEGAVKKLTKKYAEMISAGGQLGKFADSDNPAYAGLQKDLKEIGAKGMSLMMFHENYKGALANNPTDAPRLLSAANKTIEDADRLQAALVAIGKTIVQKEMDSAPASTPLLSGKEADQTMQQIYAGDEYFLKAQTALLLIEKFHATGDSKKKGKKSETSLDHMGVAELVAVYGYTTADFDDINWHMRGVDKGLSPARRSQLDEQEEIAVNALGKLLPYNKGKTLYRKDENAFFAADLAKTGIRSDKAFLSTSVVSGNTAFGNVLSIIEPKKNGKGRLIDFSLHEKEQEVLFLPDARFQFVKFVPCDDDCKKIGKKSGYVVTLKEELRGYLHDWNNGFDIKAGTFYLKEV